MFLDYFGLKEQPFGVTPDPRYLYLSPTHREALSSLVYGIQTRRGFVALIAKPGMGKTTLLAALQESMRGAVRFLFFCQTQCDSRELLRSILRKLGMRPGGRDLFEMHEKVSQFLTREMLAGQQFVLVIDEAQNLDNSVLETLRLLSNCETPSSKLLQVLLAGQPQLAARFSMPELEQLRQRIGITARIESLNSEETSHYIAYRLGVAGWHGGGLFSSSALGSIAELSEGIPRKINNICFGALSLGYATDHKRIDSDLVKEAATDLDISADLVPVRSETVEQARPVVATRAPAPCLSWTFLRSWARISPIESLRRTLEFIPRPVAITALACALFLLGAFAALWHVRTRVAGISEFVQAPRQNRVTAPVLPSASQVSAQDHRGTVIVRRGDTLKKICEQYFKRGDLEGLQKVLLLNPSIKNPDFIMIGQQITLPEGP